MKIDRPEQGRFLSMKTETVKETTVLSLAGGILNAGSNIEDQH